MAGKTASIHELADLLGVSARTIHGWRRQHAGCPSPAGNQWPVRAVCEWVVATVGRGPAPDAARKVLACLPPEEKKAAGKQPRKQREEERDRLPPLPTSLNASRNLGLIGALNRARAYELAMAERFEQMFKDSQDESLPADERAYAMLSAGKAWKAWLDSAKTLREVEQGLTEVMEKQGKLAPVDIIKTKVVRLCDTAKSRIMLVPKKVAPLCEGLEWPEIAHIMENELRDVCRDLSADGIGQ